MHRENCTVIIIVMLPPDRHHPAATACVCVCARIDGRIGRRSWAERWAAFKPKLPETHCTFGAHATDSNGVRTVPGPTCPTKRQRRPAQHTARNANRMRVPGGVYGRGGLRGHGNECTCVCTHGNVQSHVRCVRRARQTH